MVAPNATVPAFVIAPDPVVVLLKVMVVPAAVVNPPGIEVAPEKIICSALPVVVAVAPPAPVYA